MNYHKLQMNVTKILKYINDTRNIVNKTVILLPVCYKILNKLNMIEMVAQDMKIYYDNKILIENMLKSRYQ